MNTRMAAVGGIGGGCWIPSASMRRPNYRVTGTTESLHMIEKFRRPEFDKIEYEATIEDPNVFDKPWTIARTFTLRPDLKRIDEFICENNRDYRPLFGR